MKPLGTTAKTGEKCPESGVWEVVGYFGDSEQSIRSIVYNFQ